METSPYRVTFAYTIAVAAANPFEAVQHATIQFLSTDPGEIKDNLTATGVEPLDDDDEEE